MALMNGIPISSLSNDGYNAKILRKDAEARQALKIQLNISSYLAQGKSMKEMPKEWFSWEEKIPKNNLTASAGYMRFEYLIEYRRFEEAEQLGTFLLEHASSLANIHELMIRAELLFCHIMLDHEKEKIKEMYQKEQKKIAVLKSIPSAQRIFYPYPSEIRAERELIAFVGEKSLHNRIM